MSANIPDTMLLSDLLKLSGYNCPDELLGKTFAEATTGGEGPTLVNLTATEDKVYTPDTGKAYKKVTVNVHSTLYAWKNDTDVAYTKVATPTTSDKALVGASTGLTEVAISAVGEDSITVSDTKLSRYEAGDIAV